MDLTRRQIAKLGAAAMLPGAFGAPARPDSNFGGVQIGINAPYSFRGMSGTAEDVLRYLLELGLSSVELRSQPVEASLGAPVRKLDPLRGPAPSATGQSAAEAAEALEKWRLSASFEGVRAFRRKWNEAGVDIDIVKFDGVNTMKDEVVDYAFQFAKALGARALSCEIPVSRTRWLSEFAARHQLMVGYHGHGNVTNPEAFATPESWERSMSYSKYNGINLDIGHFTAGNNMSPIPFIRKHADRITHVHLKDRKRNNGPNMPWGQGDTPVREVLQLMKQEKYPFQGTIEYEYPLPAGSTVMQEIAKCVQFCRESLA